MHNKIVSGAHLGVVHSWIKWHYCMGNGERVLWGSHDLLVGKDVHVDELERLAQDIRDAVLKEHRVKAKEHVYSYVVFAESGAPAFQYVDTAKEAWSALFRATGDVMIWRRDCSAADSVVKGTADEVRAWLLENELPVTKEKEGE